jgi:hypothetical protein
MNEEDLTFNQWCVEVAGLVYYEWIAECDYDYYYNLYLEYLESH